MEGNMENPHMDKALELSHLMDQFAEMPDESPEKAELAQKIDELKKEIEEVQE